MKQWILITIGLLISVMCHAQLIVVNTDGPTVAADAYLTDIHYPKKKDALKLLQMNKLFFRKKNIQLQKLMYPVISQLTPGKIKSYLLKTKGLAKPFFVIGDDPMSIHWAKMNASQLRKIGAIGIITNVNDQARKKQIENETSLILLPAELIGLSQYLKVSHYPFLWTENDIEQ